MKKLLISFVLILSIVGCSSVDLGFVEEPAFQISIKQITGRYIERADNVVERAVRVVAKATEYKNFIDLQPRTLVELKEELQKRIISKGVRDSDSLLLLDLSEIIEIQLNADIEEGIISAEQSITINNALDLIINRAKLYIP